MKYIQLIFSCIIALSTITCHVTDRPKYTNFDTTPVLLENDMRHVSSKNTSEKTYEKHVREDKSSVYLDDVLFTLKTQEWSAEELQCLDDIYRLLYGLQNFTLWAVWDWDALASEPQGLLFGNRYQLGNFDQCMNPPWSKAYPELRTKYCLAEIVLERTDKAVRHRVEKPFDPYKSALDFIQYRPQHSRPLNELTWGACVPSTCLSHTVERLLGVMLARSHLGAAGMRANITLDNECQTSKERKDFDTLFYAFITVMAALMIACIVCTYVNTCRKEESHDTRTNGIIKAFCLKENAQDLLRMKKEGTEVFYGIRYLTMCLIVLDHQLGIYNAGPISDGLTTDQDAQSTAGLLILHDDLFVDTFFLLSGFLTMSTLMKFEKLPNLFLIILKRYIRLVIALAVMIFFICAVYPYTGSGPLWSRAVAQDTVQCRKNWWLNLLMVNNYIDTENICMVTSWYIPCDFHFFVVTVFVYWLYKHWPKLGLSVAAVLTIAAVVLPGVINYVYQLPAVHLFTFEYVTNPRGGETFHIAYIKSHIRYGAHLVGAYSGYAFATINTGSDSNMKKIKKLFQKWSILGTCLAVILMMTVMLCGGTFLWRNYSPLEGAVYAALNRPAWAVGVALLVFCCSFGHVPIVKSFLCWYPWVPLSRLAYGLYLTHALMITRNVFTTRNPQHNDYLEILNSAAGVVVWGTLAALLLWLFVEGPSNKLLSLLVSSKKITQVETKLSNTTSTGNVNMQPSTSTGYLNDNLSSTIQYSSKV